MLHRSSFAAINSPTRETHRSSFCLDHILLRKRMDSGTLNIVESDLTDHIPTLITIHRSIPVSAPPIFADEIIQKLNIQVFNDIIDVEDIFFILGNFLFINDIISTILQYLQSSCRNYT